MAAGLVSLVRMPGRKQQANAYWEVKDRADRRRDSVRWVAVIDLDEYLQPAGGGTMLDVLREFERDDIVKWWQAKWALLRLPGLPRAAAAWGEQALEPGRRGVSSSTGNLGW